MKKRRTGVKLSQESKGKQNRRESKSIIRLANDLQAGTGYKGNYMKHTRDRLANEMTVKRKTQVEAGTEGGDGREKDADLCG